MIVASIDIGSNTVLLLLAEVTEDIKRVKTIKNYYKAPRISKGLSPGNPIPPHKKSSLINILDEYKRIINENSVDKIFVVATNAFRIASNSEEIVKEIKTKFGWDTKIIDGDTEAKFSFYGATFPLKDNNSKVMIDIGGGSTEIVYGNSSGITFKKSFQIGVVSLTESILSSNPPSEKQLKQAEEYSIHVFSELKDNIWEFSETVAVAGTPTSLSCIKQNIKNYDEAKVENSVLYYDEICRMIEEISPLSKQAMTDKYGQAVEGREDVLLAGSIILKSFMNVLGIDQITVSSKGLRYGVIIDYLLSENQ